jgi:CheY-like chemotaxis protein/signal transduction histidine kinase
VVKCRHIAAVFVSILIETIFVGLTAYRIGVPLSSVMALLLTLILQCMILYEYENFSRRMYLNQTIAIQSHKNMLSAENEVVLKDLRTAELRHLFGNVAHDLKTPLQAFSFEMDAIVSHLQLGVVNVSVSNRIENSVEIMRSASMFLQMVINRALDYSKASSGLILQPINEPESLSKSLISVRRCLRSFDDEYDERKFVVQLLSNVNDFIVTDHRWLVENLLCLTSNAQKYSKSGQVVIRCSLAETGRCSSFKTDAPISYSSRYQGSHHAPSQMLEFEVIDAGEGIPKSKRRSIFEPAQQSPRNMGGTGLGMYALRHRVLDLGGSYGVRDLKDGKPGACVWFSIPYVPANGHQGIMSWPPVAQATSPTSLCDSILFFSATPSAKVPDDGSAKILIVDDSALIRKTAARALKNAGMASDVAEDGAVCLDKVTKGDYRLILMDIQMPVMDGIESTKRIRALEHETGAPRVVIIGVSANSDSDTRNEAMAAGMDGFLPKPINVDSLKRLLKTTYCKLEDVLNDA